MPASNLLQLRLVVNGEECRHTEEAISLLCELGSGVVSARYVRANQDFPSVTKKISVTSLNGDATQVRRQVQVKLEDLGNQARDKALKATGCN